MKVLLVNKFHYQRGGSETYYLALGRALRKAGHQVVHFAMQDDRNEPSDTSDMFVRNIEYNHSEGFWGNLQVGAQTLYSRSVKHSLVELIAREKPDIAHLNLFHRQLSLSVVDVLYKANIPIVFTAHDLICVCPCYTMLSPSGICEKCLQGHYGACIRQKCVKGSTSKSVLAVLEARLAKMLHTYQKISLYIAPSTFYRDMLMRGAFTSSPVIHRANFVPGQIERAAVSTPGGPLLYAGRLAGEKGISKLIEAAARMKVPLHIAGDGPLREDIARIIAAQGAQEHIKMLGFLDKGELVQALKTCRAVVVPSEWYENSPYTVLEAQAAGKPVLCSDIGGLPELVCDGSNGFLFAPGDVEGICTAIVKLNSLTPAAYVAQCDAAFVRAQQQYDEAAYIHWLIGQYNQILPK